MASDDDNQARLSQTYLSKADDDSGKLMLLRRAASAVFLLVLLGLMAVFVMGVPAQFRSLSSGRIGIFLTSAGQGYHYIEPVPGEPAAIAGIESGSRLTAIDGVSIQTGMTTSRVLSLLTGPPASPITLEVIDPNGDLRSFHIERQAFPLEPYGLSARSYAAVMIAIGIALLIGYLIPALIIYFRRPGDWLPILIALTLILIGLFNSRAYGGFRVLPGWAAIAVSFGYHTGLLLLLCLFPDGHFVPRWTQRYVWVGIVWIAFKVLPNPWTVVLDRWNLMILIDALVFGTGIVAQIQRYRHHSGSVERQQTKWIMFGMAIAFVAQYAYYIPLNWVPHLQSYNPESLRFQLVGTAATHLLLLAVPISFTYAIRRHRLYDIDLIINRTLVYVPLSAIVAGVYAAVELLFKNLFIALTGKSSDAAVVLATLVIVAMISPLKDRMQDEVDKRFKGGAHAEKILSGFEEMVKTRMHTVEAVPILSRLLEQAVEAYKASGGVVFLWQAGKRRAVFAVGSGYEPPTVCADALWDGELYGRICLGTKHNKDTYSPTEIAALQSACEVAAQAIHEDHAIDLVFQAG